MQIIEILFQTAASFPITNRGLQVRNLMKSLTPKRRSGRWAPPQKKNKPMVYMHLASNDGSLQHPSL